MTDFRYVSRQYINRDLVTRIVVLGSTSNATQRRVAIHMAGGDSVEVVMKVRELEEFLR